MMLKNVLWNIFQDTGSIDAYLFYRNCDGECQESKSENMADIEQGLPK